jgi:hypothetical protein
VELADDKVSESQEAVFMKASGERDLANRIESS